MDPGDPVFVISALIEGLDLESFERWYDHAYPPRLMLKLWLFGTVAGVYSGREIARRLRWDPRFRHLAGGQAPDFRTLNRFRHRHRVDLALVFRQTLQTARASGREMPGWLASREAMSHERMQPAVEHLEEEVLRILARLDEVNESEDAEHGADDGAGGPPAELRDR